MKRKIKKRRQQKRRKTRNKEKINKGKKRRRKINKRKKQRKVERQFREDKLITLNTRQLMHPRSAWASDSRSGSARRSHRYRVKGAMTRGGNISEPALLIGENPSLALMIMGN